jgi:hypothetical protein
LCAQVLQALVQPGTPLGERLQPLLASLALLQMGLSIQVSALAIENGA